MNCTRWSKEVAANFSTSQFPPPSFRTGPSVDKYVDIEGVAVIAPWHVHNSFLIRAQGVVIGMFLSRTDLLEDLVARRTKVAIKTATRGLAIRGRVGWWAYTPQHDTYCHVMVHEIAHLVHFLFEDEENPFDLRIQTMYEDALAAGLWESTYAASDHYEYFAEGVNFQITDEYESRYSSTLAEYDPNLAALVDEVFGTTTLPASCDE